MVTTIVRYINTYKLKNFLFNVNLIELKSGEGKPCCLVINSLVPCDRHLHSRFRAAVSFVFKDKKFPSMLPDDKYM
jgi:hypothetical protein